MKLGEAKKRVEHVDNLLAGYEAALASGPLKGMSTTLDECTHLLREKQVLEKRIEETEATSEIEGTTLADLLVVFQTLQRKINLLAILAHRKDLGEEQKDKLFEQLNTLRITRDQLDLSISRCFWETKLLDE